MTHLDDQLTSTRYDCAACSPVRVLPVDAVILLMNADNVRSFLAVPIGSNDHTIQVLDHSQAIAPKLKIVGAVAETAVAEVEGLFAVER